MGRKIRLQNFLLAVSDCIPHRGPEKQLKWLQYQLLRSIY